MTNDPLYHRFRELSWRRELTAAEESELRTWLAAHPDAQADWEVEAGLSEALGRLPDVPVASNFTARVLQAVERESLAGSHQPASIRRRWHWRLRWLPRAAVAAVVLAAGLVSYHHVRVVERKRLLSSVALVSDVSSLPSPKILEDFDAIRAVPATPPADEQLLALLK